MDARRSAASLLGLAIAGALFASCSGTATRADAAATPGSSWSVPGEQKRVTAAGKSPVPKASSSASPKPSPKPSAESYAASEGKAPTQSKPAPAPQAVEALANVPALLREVEAKYSQAGTVSARFTQTTFTSATKQKKESSGVILAQRPGKVRWETLTPEKNLLVSDGKTYWFYTPPFDETEAGQLIEKKASQVQSRLANALLSGEFSSERGLKIRELSPTRFLLTPRKGSAGTVETAEITVDPEKKIITQVSLKNRGGNRSDIALTEVKLGEKIDARLFGFIAPPNTERIQD